MAPIDGQKVLFGGDSFQPPSRWNGAGGFCAYNGSRFREGFMRSAQLAIDWRPDLVAAGHGTYVRFNRAYYRKVMRWAVWAERVVTALCPTGDLAADYYRWPVTS
jgi:glyoxylase-like metal-dependent hydrolase (beta-lactamase superfamily II)